MTIRDLMDTARANAHSQSAANALRDMWYAPKYAGDDKHDVGVVFGDWNDSTEYVGGKCVVLDDTMSRLFDALEDIGAACEWEDEWTACMECNGAIRTSPDCYYWRKDYWENEYGDIVCGACVREDDFDYIEEVMDDSKLVRFNTILTDEGLAGAGLMRVDVDRFQTGLHDGMDDIPREVCEAIRACGISRYVLNHDEQSQFYSEWSAYVDCDTSCDAMDELVQRIADLKA